MARTHRPVPANVSAALHPVPIVLVERPSARQFVSLLMTVNDRANTKTGMVAELFLGISMSGPFALFDTIERKDSLPICFHADN
jgi:hypothetical protein